MKNTSFDFSEYTNTGDNLVDLINLLIAFENSPQKEDLSHLKPGEVLDGWGGIVKL